MAQQAKQSQNRRAQKLTCTLADVPCSPLRWEHCAIALMIPYENACGGKSLSSRLYPQQALTRRISSFTVWDQSGCWQAETTCGEPLCHMWEGGPVPCRSLSS